VKRRDRSRDEREEEGEARVSRVGEGVKEGRGGSERERGRGHWGRNFRPRSFWYLSKEGWSRGPTAFRLWDERGGRQIYSHRIFGPGEGPLQKVENLPTTLGKLLSVFHKGAEVSLRLPG